MSFTGELKDSAGRMSEAKNELISLLNSHKIGSIKGLKRAFKEDPGFKSEWNRIWREVACKDGGKLSITSALVILGSVLGGVGIAAGGGAIGLPLALVLGLAGLLFGTEVDERRKEAREEQERISIAEDA